MNLLRSLVRAIISPILLTLYILSVGQRSKTFLSGKCVAKAVWKQCGLQHTARVSEKGKDRRRSACVLRLPFRLLCSTGSCHTAKLTWETHRTAELNRFAASGSTAKAFHPSTAILKRNGVSEAFREKAHLVAALFKIWPCAC